MIVADTNVLSEPLRPTPNRQVLDWLTQHRGRLAITAITVGELYYGAERLPEGRRRTQLLVTIDQLVERASERVLRYDDDAARVYGRLRAEHEARGLSMSVEDAMIAATCLSTDSALATRNIKDFRDTGLRLVNPWQ